MKKVAMFLLGVLVALAVVIPLWIATSEVKGSGGYERPPETTGQTVTTMPIKEEVKRPPQEGEIYQRCPMKCFTEEVCNQVQYCMQEVNGECTAVEQ